MTSFLVGYHFTVLYGESEDHDTRLLQGVLVQPHSLIVVLFHEQGDVPFLR